MKHLPHKDREKASGLNANISASPQDEIRVCTSLLLLSQALTWTISLDLFFDFFAF